MNSFRRKPAYAPPGPTPPPPPGSNPYLAAWHAYHAHGAPYVEWGAALDFHHQAGRVVSLERVFFMARPVPIDDETRHTELYRFTEAEARGDCWHVWAAAGDLRELADHLDGIRVLTFHRHGVFWLKRWSADRLRRLAYARRD